MDLGVAENFDFKMKSEIQYNADLKLGEIFLFPDRRYAPCAMPFAILC
jgi:hypothetical protein